jgi:hypothetical protein
MPKRKEPELQLYSSKGAVGKRPSPLFGLIFIGAGTFPLLLGLGVINVHESAHAPLFVVASIGIAFIAGGLASSLQGLGVPPNGFIMKILGLCMVSAILTPFGWIVFGQNDIDMSVKIIFGLFLAFFGLIFLLATIASFAPNLMARLGIRIGDNNETEKPRISKHRKL